MSALSRKKIRLSSELLKNRDTSPQKRTNPTTVGCSTARGPDQHLLNVLRSKTQPLNFKKHCPPVDQRSPGSFFMAAHWPAVDALCLLASSLPLQVWMAESGPRTAQWRLGNKKSIQLSHAVYGGFCVPAHEWVWGGGPLCECAFLFHLWQLFHIDIFKVKMCVFPLLVCFYWSGLCI